MRVVGYATAMPVPDRYRSRFPVVRHDVDRLAVSVIELPENRIAAAEDHGYVVPLSVIELPENRIAVAEDHGYVVPLSVIELPENRIAVAEDHGYVVPATTPAFRLVYIRMVVTFAGMYFVFSPFSLGALVASTTNSVPVCPHFVRAQP
jgi:hypothetical protein